MAHDNTTQRRTTATAGLSAVLTCLAAILLSACGSDDAGTRPALDGLWRMTSLESGGPDNYRSAPYTGEIAFTDRTVSVQAMNPDTTAPDTPYTVRGYEAFYGELTVDVQAGTFAVRVTSAAARDLIGQTLTRQFRVSGDTLVLTPVDSSEGWRVTYTRER